MSDPSNPYGIPDKPYETYSQNPPLPAPPYQPYYPPQRPEANTSGLAVASMVLGICGVVFSWFTFGVPSLLAVIFGGVAFKQTGPGGRNGRGMAITGLVLGVIMLVLGIWISAAIIYGIGSSVNQACLDGTIDCS